MNPCPNVTSFICNMTSSRTLEWICLLIDLEGFFIEKIFYCRELGWRSRTERGNVKYRIPHYFHQLTPKDKVTTTYVTKRVHGLTFYDHPNEQAKPQACVQQDILQLYQRFKSPNQDLVAYKGGHIEKDILKRLNILTINLEHWGCPKFETLLKQGFQEVADCGHHHPSGHLSTIECETFWHWLRSYASPSSSPASTLRVQTYMENL